jgi:4-amino-4-deoxy-L-arabinose transferase-like glycosyltransferase
MVLIKRIGLLILSALVGAVIAYLLAAANAEGRFVPWESLGKPPGKVVKILAVYGGPWVETDARQVYGYKNTGSCGENCWIPSEYPRPDPGSALELTSCGTPPALGHVIDSKSVCQPAGIGYSFYVYAIRDDGQVYRWNHVSDESVSMLVLYSPFIGAIVCFLAAVPIVVWLYFLGFLERLRWRADRRTAKP